MKTFIIIFSLLGSSLILCLRIYKFGRMTNKQIRKLKKAERLERKLSKNG